MTEKTNNLSYALGRLLWHNEQSFVVPLDWPGVRLAYTPGLLNEAKFGYSRLCVSLSLGNDAPSEALSQNVYLALIEELRRLKVEHDEPKMLLNQTINTSRVTIIEWREYVQKPLL